MPNDKDWYYLEIAEAASKRADCVGRQVGAVLVKGDRIIATGYNGTPSGMANCKDGGCLRCRDRRQFPSGTAYDLCICVHAEANALATAARFGIATEATTLYTTDQPCFACSKELLQAGVERVYYERPWAPDSRVRDDYLRLQGHLWSVQLLRKTGSVFDSEDDAGTRPSAGVSGNGAPAS